MLFFSPDIEKLNSRVELSSYPPPSFYGCYCYATFALSTYLTVVFGEHFQNIFHTSQQFTPKYCVCLSMYIIRLRSIFYVTAIG